MLCDGFIALVAIIFNAIKPYRQIKKNYIRQRLADGRPELRGSLAFARGARKENLACCVLNWPDRTLFLGGRTNCLGSWDMLGPSVFVSDGHKNY